MPKTCRDGHAGTKSLYWSCKILHLSPLQTCAKEKYQLQLVWHNWVGFRLIFLYIFIPKVRDFMSLKTAKTEGDTDKKISGDGMLGPHLHRKHSTTRGAAVCAEKLPMEPEVKQQPC